MDVQDLAILKGLVVVAWVDGKMAEGERELIEAFINAFGATDEEAAQVREFAKEPRTFADIPITDLSGDDRRTLLNHAVVLTYMDGEQHEAEAQILEDLRAALRIPEGEGRRIVEAATARAQRLVQLSQPRQMNPQDRAILEGLVAVAWIDGRVADEEREHIEALISAFGATDKEAEAVREFAKTPRTLADIPITDLSADDRKVLLNHAVVLSFVDGEQTPDEKQALVELTAALRIPEADAQRIVDAATARARRLLQMQA